MAGVVVAGTLVGIGVWQALPGEGGSDAPNEGEQFRVGAQQFEAAAALVGSALAQAGWQGDSAVVYSDEVVAVQDLVASLADLDVQIADLVTMQADEVSSARAWVKVGFATLFAVLPVVIILEINATTRPTAWTIALQTCGAILSECMAVLLAVSARSYFVAAEVSRVGESYAAVAATLAGVAASGAGMAHPPIPAAMASAAPSSEDAPAGTQGTSTVAGAAMPGGAARGRAETAAGDAEDRIRDLVTSLAPTAPPLVQVLRAMNWTPQSGPTSPGPAAGRRVPGAQPSDQFAPAEFPHAGFEGAGPASDTGLGEHPPIPAPTASQHRLPADRGR